MSEGFTPDRKDGSIERPLDKPLFEVTLMRHAKPFYKDEGHDLTPEGVEQARSAGEHLKETGYFDEADVFLVHSPKARAKGTIDFVAEAAGLSDLARRTTRQLRSSDFADNEAFMQSVRELAELEGINVNEAAAKHHYVHPMHEEGVVIEKHSRKRERLYRALEHLARWFDTHAYQGAKTPHILAVSHFEVMTHLIHDVFDIATFNTYNTPAFAETIRIQAYPTNSKEKLRLVVSYKNQNKEVVFDRKTRSIVHPDHE